MSKKFSKVASGATSQKSESGPNNDLIKMKTTITTTSFVKKLVSANKLDSSLVLEISQRSGIEVAKEWRRIARLNVTAGTGRKTLSRRSGGLVGSIAYRTQKTPRGLNILLLSVFYGGVHNDGKVIRAKRQPYLKYFIPGIGWRQSRRVVIPRRPWSDDAWEKARQQYPEFVRKEIQKEMVRLAAIIEL